jgi:hypothetical protein
MPEYNIVTRSMADRPKNIVNYICYTVTPQYVKKKKK